MLTTQEAKSHAENVGNSFPWHELNVPDQAAAIEFYGNVMGWTTHEMDMGEMGTYTMFCNDCAVICGIMPTVGEHANVPPHWSVYLAVNDVDATAAKVQSGGGTVMVPAFDIPTVGRMCLCQDPQGAVFWIYKSSN